MHNIFSRLEGVGYGDFKKENPKVMIQLIQEWLYPHTVKAEMGKHLRFQRGLKTDLKAFIKLCCTEAKNVDRYSAKPKRSNEGQGSNERHTTKPISKSSGSNKTGGATAPTRKPPLCLKPNSQKGRKEVLS